MDEKKKLIITIVITSVLVTVFIGLLLYQFSILGVGPFTGDESLRTVIAKKEAELAGMKSRLATELPLKKAEKGKLEPLQKEANELLPVEIAPERLLKFINAKAELALVDLVSVDSEKVKAKVNVFGGGGGGPFQEIKYKMDIVGNLDELALFINYMEMFELVNESGNSQKRFFEVKDLVIKADKNGISEDGRHKIKLKMSTYMKKKKANKGPGF
ncbi:MAG: hypothetical protein ACYTFY_00525 [Planctomycetota bacterium]|jgi:hypothetical protein